MILANWPSRETNKETSRKCRFSSSLSELIKREKGLALTESETTSYGYLRKRRRSAHVGKRLRGRLSPDLEKIEEEDREEDGRKRRRTWKDDEMMKQVLFLIKKERKDDAKKRQKKAGARFALQGNKKEEIPKR